MSAPGSDPSVILRAEKVSKVFPGTIALDGVDYQARRAAVNVLVGENGAGKSTLTKILAGVEEPTSGRLFLDERPVSFPSVHAAAAHGIGMVFQELNLCPNLSITENIFLAHPIARARIHIDRRRQAERARALMRRLAHDIDPDTPVGELRIGEQQIVEIARALSRDVKVLIMDEPTSALSAADADVLFRIIADLARADVTIIYISHRLEEVMRIGDHISVLRDGRMQKHARIADIDIPWIIDQMVGRTQLAQRRPVAPARGTSEVLRVEGVSLAGGGGKKLLDDVSFTVSAGETVGIYGLMGAGRSELFECLFGLRPEASGKVWVGRDISRLPPAARIESGVFLVPEDRQRDGLFPNLSTARNLGISSLRRLRRFISIDSRREREMVRGMIERLHIRASSPDVSITALSGGNQQKVVIGKSLLTGPKLLLLDEPTRGIDIGAKAEVFKIMRGLADSGLAVVFATSDLKEVMLADRIIVMAQGRIATDLLRDDATEELLVAASARGLSPSPAAAGRAAAIES